MQFFRQLVLGTKEPPKDCIWLNNNEVKAFVNGDWELLSNCSIKICDTIADLPIKGEDNFLYYTKSNHVFYYWDDSKGTYEVLKFEGETHLYWE